MSRENDEAGASMRNRVVVRVVAAVLLGVVGLFLLKPGSAAPGDTLIVMHDGETREVPIDSDIVAELQELTGPGGVLSRDPGAQEFSDELAERRDRAGSPDWAFLGGVGSLVLAAGFLFSALSVSAPAPASAAGGSEEVTLP